METEDGERVQVIGEMMITPKYSVEEIIIGRENFVKSGGDIKFFDLAYLSTISRERNLHSEKKMSHAAYLHSIFLSFLGVNRFYKGGRWNKFVGLFIFLSVITHTFGADYYGTIIAFLLAPFLKVAIFLVVILVLVDLYRMRERLDRNSSDVLYSILAPQKTSEKVIGL